jgi:hypothetical protein
VQWAYTDLTDPRWRVGTHLIALTPARDADGAQKIGTANERGWCAVIYDDCVFVKQTQWIVGAEYPDLGCSTELFTIGAYLEVETLAPLRLLDPDASASHTEIWRVFHVSCRSAVESDIAT